MDFQSITQEMDYIQKRNTVTKNIEKMVEDVGYTKVNVDFFESYDDFTNQNKRINPNTMVKLINPSGTISILRPDITTNIIQQVANKWVDQAKVKLYYDSTIFRQNNRNIEQLHQFGLEQLGYTALTAETDVLSTLINLVDSYNLTYKIRLGHQAFIDALFDGLSLSAQELIILKNDLQAKNQSGINNVLLKNNLDKNIALLLQNVLTFEGPLEKINKQMDTYPLTANMKDALKDINNVLSSLPTNTSNIWIDLSLITNYDYYNGLLLEGYLQGVPTPFVQGGRYDKLTKQFGKDIKAFGISIDYQAFLQEVISYE